MSKALFALLAFHGGNVYQIDSNLTQEDCAALLAPGVVSFFESEFGVFIRPDATTRFECEAQFDPGAIVQPSAPATNPKFARGISQGSAGPNVTAYGSGRMSPGVHRQIMKTTRQYQRKGYTRGRPSVARTRVRD